MFQKLNYVANISSGWNQQGQKIENSKWDLKKLQMSVSEFLKEDYSFEQKFLIFYQIFKSKHFPETLRVEI